MQGAYDGSGPGLVRSSLPGRCPSQRMLGFQVFVGGFLEVFVGVPQARWLIEHGRSDEHGRKWGNPHGLDTSINRKRQNCWFHWDNWAYELGKVWLNDDSRGRIARYPMGHLLGGSLVKIPVYHLKSYPNHLGLGPFPKV